MKTFRNILYAVATILGMYLLVFKNGPLNDGDWRSVAIIIWVTLGIDITWARDAVLNKIKKLKNQIKKDEEIHTN